MIYGFSDIDKSKFPINLKYEGNGVIKGIESDNSETTVTPTIKRTFNCNLMLSSSAVGQNQHISNYYDYEHSGTTQLPDDLDISKLMFYTTAMYSDDDDQFLILQEFVVAYDSYSQKNKITVHFYTNKVSSNNMYIEGKLVEYY